MDSHWATASDLWMSCLWQGSCNPKANTFQTYCFTPGFCPIKVSVSLSVTCFCTYELFSSLNVVHMSLYTEFCQSREIRHNSIHPHVAKWLGFLMNAWCVHWKLSGPWIQVWNEQSSLDEKCRKNKVNYGSNIRLELTCTTSTREGEELKI